MKKSNLPNPFNKIQHYPDAKAHQTVSFIKSFFRIIGYIYLPFNIWVAAGFLVVSEILGIYEELV